MLVIDGKYNNEDGMGTGRMYKVLSACFTSNVDLSLMASTVVMMAQVQQWRWQGKKDKIPWGFGCEISGGTKLRKIRATKLKIHEFAEEKEDRDPVTVGSHSNFPKGRQPLDMQKLRGR